jgi:hypothetical protein
MDKSSSDVRCILLSLLSGYEVARMARVNRAFYITVAKFFKQTKTLILTGHYCIDATKLSRWPSLSYFRTIEIHNLYVNQNVHLNFSENLLYLYLSCYSSHCNNTLSFNSTHDLQGETNSRGGRMQVDSGDFDCEIGLDAVWVKYVGAYAFQHTLYTDPEDVFEHYDEKKEEEENDDHFLEYMIAEAEDMELEE